MLAPRHAAPLPVTSVSTILALEIRNFPRPNTLDTLTLTFPTTPHPTPSSLPHLLHLPRLPRLPQPLTSYSTPFFSISHSAADCSRLRRAFVVRRSTYSCKGVVRQHKCVGALPSRRAAHQQSLKFSTSSDLHTCVLTAIQSYSKLSCPCSRGPPPPVPGSP